MFCNMGDNYQPLWLHCLLCWCCFLLGINNRITEIVFGRCIIGVAVSACTFFYPLTRFYSHKPHNSTGFLFWKTFWFIMLCTLIASWTVEVMVASAIGLDAISEMENACKWTAPAWSWHSGATGKLQIVLLEGKEIYRRYVSKRKLKLSRQEQVMCHWAKAAQYLGIILFGFLQFLDRSSCLGRFWSPISFLGFSGEREIS